MSLLEQVRMFASRHPGEYSDLLALLWGEWGNPRIAQVQIRARAQLARLITLGLIRELQKSAGFLPNLGDNLTSMTITQGLQWIHAAAGGATAKRPAAWAALPKVVTKYGTLTGADPMRWEIAIDYATWTSSQLGKLADAIAGLHVGKARIVQRITVRAESAGSAKRVAK